MLTCGAAGIVSCSNAPHIFSSPAPALAVIRCPSCALSEPSCNGWSSPNTARTLSISSRSPTAVPVAWHSRYSTLAGANPAAA